MKLLMFNILSKIYNSAFKKRTNEFVYLITLSAIINKCVSLTGADTMPLFIFLIVCSAILAITTVRPSNNTVYSILTKHLSMNINDSSQYHALDYYEDRKEIAELFKEEFIRGLVYLHINPFCKTIKLTTHKWVYDEIICSKDVQIMYNVTVKQSGKTKIPQEVLLLNSNKSFGKNKERLNNTAFQEREQYKIILKRK